MIEQLNALNSFIKKDSKAEDYAEEILFIALTEWGWSYKEFIETPLPLIFSLLDQRAKIIDKQNKQLKKGKK